MPTNPIDATFEDVPMSAEDAPPRVVPNAAPAPSTVDLFADFLDLGGTVAQAGASIAAAHAPDAAQRVARVGEAARAGAEVVREGAQAVAAIQAETQRVAGPLAQKIRELDQKARAAGLYGQRAAPRGIHRGPPRPVTVKVGSK